MSKIVVASKGEPKHTKLESHYTDHTLCRKSGTATLFIKTEKRKAVRHERDFSDFEKSLYERIDVRMPYFALQNISEINKNTLQASIDVEQPLGHEAGPICSAEVGRHLAILGSCAAAHCNPKKGKHYYLASKSVVERLCTDTKTHETLFVTASAYFHSNNRAVTQAYLHNKEGKLLYRVDVIFQVISDRLFRKIFKTYKQNLRQILRSENNISNKKTRNNPYQLPKLTLEKININNSRLTGSLLNIDAKHCSGHFPLYPALPVSKLIDTLNNYIGVLLTEMIGSKYDKYMLHHSTVISDNLAFAGDDLHCTIDLIKVNKNRYLFDCRADAITPNSSERRNVGIAISEVEPIAR